MGLGLGSGSGWFAQLERVMRLHELRFAFSVRSLGVAAKFLHANTFSNRDELHRSQPSS